MLLVALDSPVYHRLPSRALSLSLSVSLIVRTTVASWPRAAHCCSIRSSAAPSSVRSLPPSLPRFTLPYKTTPPCATALAIPSPATLLRESADSSSFFGTACGLFSRGCRTQNQREGRKGYKGAGKATFRPLGAHVRRGEEGSRERWARICTLLRFVLSGFGFWEDSLLSR